MKPWEPVAFTFLGGWFVFVSMVELERHIQREKVVAVKLANGQIVRVRAKW